MRLGQTHELTGLINKVNAGWFMIDFKTDEVRSDAESQSARTGMTVRWRDMLRHISNQLKAKAKTRLVFLNVNGEVKIYD